MAPGVTTRGAAPAVPVTAPSQSLFPLWGGWGEVTVADPASSAAAMALVTHVLERVTEAASPVLAGSEVNRVNRAAAEEPGRAITVSPMLAAIVAASLRLAAATRGACDPTVGRVTVPGLSIAWGEDNPGPGEPVVVPYRQLPGNPAQSRPASEVTAAGWRSVALDQQAMTLTLADGIALDLGGVAKAWAADRSAELVADRLGCGVLVGLCGDISVSGPPPPQGWLVQVAEDHRLAGEPGAVVGMGADVVLWDGGLATSSTATRRRPVVDADGRPTGSAVAHIVDPRAGVPVAGPWRTVTVAARTCAQANAAAVAALVAGSRAIDYLQELGVPARAVHESGHVEVLGGWPL